MTLSIGRHEAPTVSTAYYLFTLKFKKQCVLQFCGVIQVGLVLEGRKMMIVFCFSSSKNKLNKHIRGHMNF